uniref:Uncharacterized protein n=1 Tax=Cajanus cajan TaxID=3821 RepID=A0A151T2G3_CAJCA|nr:hypothetical protein KK1_023644 [Cajanus cajan]
MAPTCDTARKPICLTSASATARLFVPTASAQAIMVWTRRIPFSWESTRRSARVDSEGLRRLLGLGCCGSGVGA